MFRISAILMVLCAFLAGASVKGAQPDYVDRLMKLSELTSSGQFRDAINGYRKLEAEPGTPEWLKAGCEYEIAELYATLNDSDNAITALTRAVHLGFDDCLSPRASEHLATVLKNPKATQAIAGMMIIEGDVLELFWLKSEVEHAFLYARMMTTENINRVDQHDTEIPQAQLPTRPTTSPGVLYWRQQLLLIQRAQREFVTKSDQERMIHAASMTVISGGSQSAVLESARLAQAAAESRKAEIRKRAFVPVASSDRLKPCSTWSTSLR